jgi:hypothetical protein
MKVAISFQEITERADRTRTLGFTPEPALMIGGVYQGKAIDRHLFRFTAGLHTILIEPPVYNKGLAYTRGSGGTGPPKNTERIGHYYPDMGPPLRAEVVVPLKLYDGRQHLRVVPAQIEEAPAGSVVEGDSVTPDLMDSSEVRQRKLYRLRFDLSGLEGARLDLTGIAVYWRYGGSAQYWMFGRGNVSAWAPTTRQAVRAEVRAALQPWIEANGGTFPHDVVLAARYGDECFYITGHVGAPVVSYPLWDFSASTLQAFREKAGDLEYPRTWGFPEVYGPDAYAYWLYNLHEGCARLCGVAREEIGALAPGLLLYRNTTRMGVFDMANDHDGSGQELLAQNLDIVHLDPYPVTRGYSPAIPRDMSYCSGLARRYGRLLIPWMQAHTYGNLQHVTPEQVDRMTEEQYQQGVDAVVWLGYGGGNTFPRVNPESWERAGAFHRRLATAPPPKPKARLAVLRGYTARSLCSRWENGIRNPADWLLQQLLEVWAVQHRQPYDVFEVPPHLSPEADHALKRALRAYPFVVSTLPWPGAWVIGADTNGTVVDPASASEVCRQFEAELRRRGWLPGL